MTHTDEEWHKLLTADQFAILRREGTERPFTSPLLREQRAGLYACAGCGQDAFSSTTKYDPGEGWPSFWQPLDKAVATRQDMSFGMSRTEVHCSRCGSHLGHVFDDGPQPTGLRYCMDGGRADLQARHGLTPAAVYACPGPTPESRHSMILFLLAYLGGILTIVSPCILPVLPFVFARADRPFLRSGLPMLVGMAATFALVATLAAVGGGWAVEANQYGRLVAIVLLALFGITLLFPSLSDRLTRRWWRWARACRNRPKRARAAARRSCRRSCSASPPACSGLPAPARCWASS